MPDQTDPELRHWTLIALWLASLSIIPTASCIFLAFNLTGTPALVLATFAASSLAATICAF